MSVTRKPSLSIVIPSWNGRGLLEDCLESLQWQTVDPIEVIVVDDGSTDDTVAFLAKQFPDIRVIAREQNEGFAIAMNTGLRAAKGEWVFALNNDVTLAPECLEQMLTVARESQASIVTPLILWRDEPATIFAAGDRVLPNGRAVSIGYREPRKGFEFPDEVFGATFAAVLVHRSVFETVGCLDEQFVAYFEDVDFCFRARLSGVKVALAKDAMAFHIGSASLAGKNWWRSKQCFTNHSLLVLKNMPTVLIFLNGPAIFWERLHQAKSAFSAARAEFGARKALVVMAGAIGRIWLLIPHIVKERVQTQRAAQISTKELNRLLHL